MNNKNKTKKVMTKEQSGKLHDALVDLLVAMGLSKRVAVAIAVLGLGILVVFGYLTIQGCSGTLTYTQPGGGSISVQLPDKVPNVQEVK